MLKFLAVAVLCVGIAGATGFTNGSFSCAGDPNSDPTTCGFAVPTGAYWQFLAPASTAIAGWTSGGEGINWTYEYNSTNTKGWETTVSGDSLHYSVGLQGNPTASTWGVGSISQTFDTVAGVSYVVTYLYSMAPNAVTAGKESVWATVRADLLDPQYISYVLASHPGYVGKSDLDWALGIYKFTASGSSTVLTFQSNETADNKVGGILLDGVTFGRDESVPEPGTMSLMLGAGLLGLGALVRRRIL